jgi:hypothetical protein
MGIENPDERSFYEIETATQGWNLAELKRDFDQGFVFFLHRTMPTLPRDANIHAREYRLYLPSKEKLRRKLQEWAEEAKGE